MYYDLHIIETSIKYVLNINSWQIFNDNANYAIIIMFP